MKFMRFPFVLCSFYTGQEKKKRTETAFVSVEMNELTTKSRKLFQTLRHIVGFLGGKIGVGNTSLSLLWNVQYS